MTTKRPSQRKQKNEFSWMGVSISLVVTLIIVASGGVYGASTNSDATYWSSAAGTAAGGMVAVLAAYFFWQADRHQAEKRREASLSHEAAQEILRLNRLVRLAAWDGVYDKVVGYPQIDDAFRTTLNHLVGQIVAQKAWLSNGSLATGVDRLSELLTADDRLEVEVEADFRLPRRSFAGTRWLDEMLVNHVKDLETEDIPLEGWDSFKKSFDAYLVERLAWEADYDVWWEGEKKRLIGENRKKSEELRSQREKKRADFERSDTLGSA